MTLSGEDVSAVSVDSMVLVMAGLMLALLIVLIVVALFLHRRNQVISFSRCQLYSSNNSHIQIYFSICGLYITYGT